MQKEFAHIEIKPIDKRPDGWTNVKAWPSQGLYRPANDNGWLTLVTADNVTILYSGVPTGSIVNNNPGHDNGINEALLLKIVAAASRAEALK